MHADAHCLALTIGRHSGDSAGVACDPECRQGRIPECPQELLEGL